MLVRSMTESFMEGRRQRDDFKDTSGLFSLEATMSTTLKAVYEGGALRLLTPLALEEGDIIEALVFERTAHEMTPVKSDARTPLEPVMHFECVVLLLAIHK